MTTDSSAFSLSPSLTAAVEAQLREFDQQDAVARMWAHDYTVWKPDPTEITNRLGWLTVAEAVLQAAPDLRRFADEIRGEGFTDIVLLGMGGSSLAPEVLRGAFGKRRGFPRLHILDSTVSDKVLRVTRAMDPATTLFVVSSKSGGTVEVMSFFRYFHKLVSDLKGKRAGKNFIAITDPGTGLQKLAEEHHFRRIFFNPADIGGRYSALSYFGMVPAALAGIEVVELLQSARRITYWCRSGWPLDMNPGAQLGAALGALAAGAGRDKVTFITSPGISLFGLWGEQLIAESTGKEGKGILPIALEPPIRGKPAVYGNDRLFAYLRLDGDDNEENDRHTASLARAGHPVLRFTLQDRSDLGAEFFRWEYATALAGAVIGIQPFDQPNVQESKDITGAVLNGVKKSGQPPVLETTGALPDLLAQARPGDYLAMLAYLHDTPAVDAALNELRAAILTRRHLPNTMGYGPRYLHSTGQLHKGGANSGLFLQLTATARDDLSVPGGGYTFDGLARAQAVGDLTALLKHGRRAIRIHLGKQPAAGIRRLTQEVKGGR